MGFEPQKFFIGLTDFFATLLPGAALSAIVWVFYNLYGSNSLEKILCEFSNWNNSYWVLFLFASYVLGHFIFAFGSYLDDLVYDQLRKCTDGGQVIQLAKENPLSSIRLRKFVDWWNVFKNGDKAVGAAEIVKNRLLESANLDFAAVNTYQWCKSRLAKDHPIGFSLVQRLEAESKFFRSFFLVLSIASICMFVVFVYTLLVFICVYIIRKEAELPNLYYLFGSISCLLGAVLSLARYVDQRFKATQNAYWAVISLEPGRDMTSWSEKPAAESSLRLSHAAGVVFTRVKEDSGDGKRVNENDSDGAVYFLLLTPRIHELATAKIHELATSKEEWVIPKGHIEPFETPKLAAIREVREETACWARVTEILQTKTLLLDGKPALTTCYLMELVEPILVFPNELESKGNEGRKLRWLRAQEAIATATHAETKDWLEKASQMIEKVKNG